MKNRICSGIVVLLLIIPMIVGATANENSIHEKMSKYYKVNIKIDDYNKAYLKSNDVWISGEDFIRKKVEQRRTKNPKDKENCNNRDGDKDVRDHDGNKCDDDIPVPINPLVGIGFGIFAVIFSKRLLLT